MKPLGWKIKANDFAPDDKTLVRVKLSRARENEKWKKELVRDNDN